MSDQKNGTTPRIAIKFGTPPSSNNLKKPSRPNPPSSLGKRPRSNAAWGGGSDSEPEDDGHRGRHEKITGFGAEGAETERKTKDPRTEKKDFVIARQPNRDWRADVKTHRKGKNLLPEEARQQQLGPTAETAPADQDTGIKWGLSVKEKPIKDEDQDAEDEQTSMNKDPKVKDEPSEGPPPPKRTADDEALDALLGKAPPKDEAIIHPTEEDAYQRAVQAAGEASTLADYEAMPVEEFGAALLRGMGWDGKPRGAKVKEVKRRPNRLGLGAKELKGEEDLGGWNQGGKKNRRPRLDEYRREESKRKDGRGRGDSYKRERERERERHRDGGKERERDRDRDYDRHRDHRDHRDRHRDDRDRRR
ncbi:Fc.00g077120.m01.CDS01 [Cosmosporella sp. VM-42]